jgi:Putative restriction endonuclease
MAAYLQQSRMTVEEYFELCRSNPDARYEYIDGQVTMLAPGSLNHARITSSVNGILGNLLLFGIDDEIPLASVGVTLSVRELYENVVF